MARQPDIQYVRPYVHGSAARKLELPRKQKVGLPKPKVRRAKPRVIYLDPLPLCALAAAGLLFVAMAVGMISLGITNARNAELEAKVSQLREYNSQLQQEYAQAYDPAQVEEKALQMGLISREDAKHQHLELTLPQPEREPGLFERVGLFFSELFA